MELIRWYFIMLKDPVVPGNRVVRKTAALTIFGVLGLIYYRHFVIGHSLEHGGLATAVMIFLLIAVVGILGGVLAASFYTSFLQRVDARNTEPSVVVFFAEWLFALTAPILPFAFFGVGHVD